MKKYFIIAFLSFLLFPLYIKGNFSSVVINEIAWMGTSNSANDEWIEMYNNTSNSINFDGWVLKAEDGTPEIKLVGTISANSFYLLERTDDTTVLGINADLIYTGALENNGEDLKLYDNLNNLIDEVDCSSGWFSGNNTTKQTMEKTSTGWQNSENPGGTPKSQNSAGQLVNGTGQTANGAEQTAEEPKSEEQSTGLAEVGPPEDYPSGIILNEVLPSPEGPDETEEWIELYNDNSFEVDLSGWRIQDSIGTITTFIFSSGTKIGAGGFLVFKRPQTKIVMNNSGDKLTLYQPDGNVIDSTEYEKATVNYSYNRIGSNWKWSSKLTPGTENIIGSASSSKETKKQSDNIEDKLVADLTKGADDAGKPFLFIFFSAILLAIILVIIFFVIKKGFTKNINN